MKEQFPFINFVKEISDPKSLPRILFDFEEFKIYDDFLKLPELINIEKKFVNRSKLSTAGTDKNSTIDIPDRIKNMIETLPGIGEYDGGPVLLSEQAFESNYLILDLLNALVCQLRSFGNYEIWILGSSYDSITNIESNTSIMCGGEPCFDKSLNERKICKPGSLIF